MIHRRVVRFGFTNVDVAIDQDTGYWVHANTDMRSKKSTIVFSAHALENLHQPFLDCIIAHELGHIKKNHQTMMYFFQLGAIALTLCVAVCAFVTKHWWLYASTAFIASTWICVQTAAARRFEHEADAFGVAMVGRYSYLSMLRWVASYMPDRGWADHPLNPANPHPSLASRIERVDKM